MSDEERVQTLVDAGILNEDLSVAEPYVEVFKKRDEAVEPESAASPS